MSPQTTNCVNVSHDQQKDKNDLKFFSIGQKCSYKSEKNRKNEKLKIIIKQ
jgi:hypothetical protein